MDINLNNGLALSSLQSLTSGSKNPTATIVDSLQGGLNIPSVSDDAAKIDIKKDLSEIKKVPVKKIRDMAMATEAAALTQQQIAQKSSELLEQQSSKIQSKMIMDLI